MLESRQLLFKLFSCLPSELLKGSLTFTTSSTCIFFTCWVISVRSGVSAVEQLNRHRCFFLVQVFRWKIVMLHPLTYGVA